MNTPKPHQDAPVTDVDPELADLLVDAWGDVPPVPATLLRRIDRTITAEWGRSPELIDSRTTRWTAAFVRAARRAKSLPIAASLALVVVLSVVFHGDSRAYAWSMMVDALVEHGIVRLDGPDGSRWMSLSEGIVSERTADSWRLLDVKQQVVLERSAGASSVRRRSVKTSSSFSNRDQLVLSFLLGGSASPISMDRLADARVIDEEWQRVTVDGRDEVQLQVRFATRANEQLELAISLDPNSRLPLACDVVGDGVSDHVALSYPAVTVADLRERDFPTALPVVDLDDSEAANVEVAAVDPAESAVPAKPAADEVKVASTDAAATIPAIAPQSDVAAIDDGATAESPLLGAASKWKPVLVSDRSKVEVLTELNRLLIDLWAASEVEPTSAADDAELLRRVYLDLAGRTPSVHEVRAYLEDTSPDRYEQLVDRLLKSPDHGSHLATVWRTFLIPEGVDLTAFGGVEAFDQWLAERFSSDDSYDEVVRSLLLAEGRLSRSGPLLFYSAVKLDPDQLASRTARVFLGMRLECAQCHDHPFEPWSQHDFWSYAAFFAQISRPQGELETVSTVMRVRDVGRGEVMLPDTTTVVAPKFLDGAQLLEDAAASARRQQLAQWLTGATNPYFARATANRVWGQLFGRGIVDPVDDFGVQHAPVSPELLDLLAGHFINSNFSLRELFRTITLSQAYRLSSGATVVDEKRLECFAQMNVKTLSAEQVYDCITVATLLESPGVASPYAFNVVRFGNSQRELFLQQFRTPVGRTTEYLGGIPQALTLMNGTLIDGATGLSSSGLLKSLEAPFFTNRQRVEVLYLATLSRQPRESEWALLDGYIPDSALGTELQEGLADILWALLNSAEFTMNH